MKNEYSVQDIKTMDDERLFVLSLLRPEYFSEIVDRYQKAFIRKAIDILRDENDAYDIVQETFVRIYAKAKQYKKLEGATFKSWAYKILINQCCTLYKKKKRQHATFAVLEDGEIENFADYSDLEYQETKTNKEYIISLLSRLPAILSRVVSLHFLHDMPQKEIATMEGVSNEVVRARIHRAKKELKKIHFQIL